MLTVQAIYHEYKYCAHVSSGTEAKTKSIQDRVRFAFTGLAKEILIFE